MRILVTAPLLVLLCAAGCGDDSDGGQAQLVNDERIVYSDDLHNENTEMIRLGDRILLIFRGGEQGQVGMSNARIYVFESTDDGRSFHKISEVSAANLPGGRDIRDPKLMERDGILSMYAISRVPGAHYRDLFGQAWTVRADSTDGGHTWSPPEKTFTDLNGNAETYWGFWRFIWREYQVAAQPRRTLYATGYNDGDSVVALFASEDGVVWQKRANIIASYDDVPSEAELQFFGENQEIAVALVRLDNQDILADGQTAICTAQEPFTNWECGRRIEQRLDGPTWLVRRDGDRVRNFVVARKHLPCTRKRTAIYELRGDLSNPDAPIEVCDFYDLTSAGDTAYTALAPLQNEKYLVSWYSSTVDGDPPWLEGQFTPSDIWLADIDFAAVPAECPAPPAEARCPVPPLTSPMPFFNPTGSYLLTLAPVIWPEQQVYFLAQVTGHGDRFDITLQPLNALTKEPVGPPWVATNNVIGDDDRFEVVFTPQALAPEAFPLLNDPFLTVHDFVLAGTGSGTDTFCGNVTGYGQVLGQRVSDRIRLEGSTFGARRIEGDQLPDPVAACS